MRFLLAVPFLAFVIVAYLLLVGGGGLMLQADAFSVALASGATLTLTFGDFFTLAGLVALFLEMLKAARPSRGTILDHMLSTAILVAALVCFLLVGACGTATFFLLTVMALVDVVAGFSVSIFSARRDFSVGPDSGS